MVRFWDNHGRKYSEKFNIEFSGYIKYTIQRISYKITDIKKCRIKKISLVIFDIYFDTCSPNENEIITGIMKRNLAHNLN